jgi:KDO2-lipid IV(A) lauroyltransferase
MVLKHRPWRTTEVEPGPEPVFVKRFHDARFPGTTVGRWRDRRRAEREARRLAQMARAGIPVPRVAGIRETEQGVELRLGFLADAIPCADVLAGARGPAPDALARTLGTLLARLHAAGLAHGDLHLRNVLVDRAGCAWIVDAAAVRRGSSAARARDLVAAAAVMRECTSARFRARGLLAYVRASSGARDTAPTGEAASVRRDEAASLVEAVEGAARIARRERVHAERDRWLRPSGVCARHTDEGLRVLATLATTREDALHLARRALAAPASLPHAVRGRDARRAWTDAARLGEHGVPAVCPRVLVEAPFELALFDPPALARGPLRAPDRAAPDDARAVGALAGTLWDRGLSLFECDVMLDADGVAGVGARAGLVHPHSLDAALRPWRGFHAAPGFAEAFLSARRGSRIQRDTLRALLAAHAERARTEPAHSKSVSFGPANGASARGEPARAALESRKRRRRAARARVLAALTIAARWSPPGAVAGALELCAPFARWTRFERTTNANLALALGGELDDAARTRIARGIRLHAARQFATWLRLAGSETARGSWIDELVHLDDSIHHLDDALAQGRGAIVATAHLGDWELLAARLARRGQRGAVVGLRRPNDPGARWFEDLRTRNGVRTIPQSAPPREILDVLARGEIVGLLCDLDARRLDGEFLPFFGHPARTLTAPAALARASGAALVPTRCVRGADGRYVLSCEEPIEFDAHAPRRDARREVLARLNAVYERWIRATPEQWAWHQERWGRSARSVGDRTATARRP